MGDNSLDVGEMGDSIPPIAALRGAMEALMSEPTDPKPAASEADLARFARAFTEWDRRYREEPERFENEAVRLLRGTPESYGEDCAPYFLSILAEQDAGGAA